MIPNWPLPSFAVVIEWDNARTAELARAHAMLRALHTQLVRLRHRVAAPPQVLVLYDRHEVPATIVENSLRLHFNASKDLCELRAEPVDGLKYYELKNAGAARTSGEVVVFLDSDVIPEPDWLQELLECFANPDVSVVGGQTYMSLDTFYDKAFSLFWFYGLRSDRTDLAPDRNYFANNVAFRRSVFERHSFPKTDLYRGACLWQTDALLRNGIQIYRQYRAGASHPAPRSLRAIILRGLWEGYDEVLIKRYWQNVTFTTVARLYVRALRRTLTRVIRDYRRAGLSRPGAIAAFMLGAAFYTFKFIGSFLTLIRPTFLRHVLPA